MIPETQVLFSLGQWFPDFSMHENHMKGSALSLSAKNSPGDANAAGGLGATFWELLS